MRNRLFLTLLLSIFTLVSYAQNNGGVKSIVRDRSNNTAVAGVEVTLNPGNIKIRTNENGEFDFQNIKAGDYTLTLEASEYESLTISVRVEDLVRNLMSVVLVPSNYRPTFEGDIFAESDMGDFDNGGSAVPASLNSSKDIFTNIASYKFSEMRFNARGYEQQFSDVYMNGVYLNDAMSGYTPWSLWSGLNDATRNQEVSANMKMSDQGVGGVAGITNINTLPSQLRKGWKASLVNGNGMYRFRAMLSYASGYQDNGWSYAFTLSTRQGGNDYVDGVYYNAYGYFGAIEKKIDDKHTLAFSILGAPTERGVQQASTQEVYDLVGSNYYNPNWGYLNGEMFNTRVKDYHEPLSMLNYTFKISDRTELKAAASFRFGRNAYSALTWNSGPDPRPDYYRYLPSYEDGNYIGANLYEAWLSNADNIRHINLDKIYNTNLSQSGDAAYGEHEAVYMIEDRNTNQRDFNFNTQISHLFKDNSEFLGGLTIRRNRTEYYSSVNNLLGADYWVDIDKYAERDFGADELAYQNNLDYYYANGHAEAVEEGDKYNYDYYGNTFSSNIWGQYRFTPVDRLLVNVGAELGYSSLWRHGIWMKGLFPDNSQGDSEILDYITYKAKVNLEYKLGGGHSFSASAFYMNDAPSFSNSFVSPRTRNSTTPGLTTEKVFGIDGSYDYRFGSTKVKLSAYYTKFNDLSDLISYYDDVESTYSNLAISNIDKTHYGFEAAASVPIIDGLSFNTAISIGNYTYSSNPNYIQIQDNSGEIKNEGKIYWDGFYVESTPQTAINVGLNYQTSNNIYLSLDCNTYNNMYLSMSPIYRTDAVLTTGMTDQQIADMRSQEKFDMSHVVNASIGKTWYLGDYNLGFSLEIKNILNNQNTKTGGYEQIRLKSNNDGSVTTYESFDSKYFYLLGTNYYLNIYLRF